MRESTFTNAICKAESKQISKDFAYCEDALGRAENAIGNLPSAQPEKRTEERTETHACDLIDRQAAIDAIIEDKICDNSLKIMTAIGDGDKAETLNMTCDRHAKMLMGLPPAQPEQPPYVAEIEAEYQKAVKMPHIHKPLAKALYEVWKKHDREDAERREE